MRCAAERTRKKQEKLERGVKLSKNQKKRLKMKLKKQTDTPADAAAIAAKLAEEERKIDEPV